MNLRVGPLLSGVLVAATAALAPPADAGGAWPRGKGHFFGAVSYATFGDVVGYVQALQYQIPGLEPPDLTEETTIYAEYGLTERLTFGIDRHARATDDTGSTVWFLRANYQRPGWQSSYGLEVGTGPYRDWRMLDDTQMRIGLSWGRGYQTRWFGGWADIDAKVSALSETGSVLWKVDSTLGVEAGERSLVYLQMQSGALDGFPAYTRAVPTWVLRLGHGISIESAALVGIRNDESYGMKVGAWMEF